MFAQRNELMKRLPGYGWEIKHIEEWASDNLDWFIIERWQIESTWSPKGKAAFITFVIDPQADIYTGNRWKSFYAVKASLQPPVTCGARENEVELYLHRGWETHLTEFMEGLNSLRNKS